MVDSKYIPLDRSVIAITGDDVKNFLQGVISNDIEKVSKDNAIYAYQLTAQGKYLYDMFISQREDGAYIIEIASVYKDQFLKKLKLYKLRSKVEINDISEEYEVVSLIGDNVFSEIGDDKTEGYIFNFCKGYVYLDPRDKKIFARSIIERENKYQSFHAKGFDLADMDEYHKVRVYNNIPEGENDLVQDKSYPLQYRMKELNGVDFEKGCYVGQEVTARTHHRGSVKKSVYLLGSDQDMDKKHGDEIIVLDKKKGEFLSSSGDKILALLDVEFAKDNKSFEIDGLKYNILS